MSAAPVVWLDGALRDPLAPALSALDRGLLYGDGVFTVLRGRGGRAVELAAHLAQLEADAGALLLRAPPRGLLEQAVAEALTAFGPAPARVRVVLTGGRGGLSVRLAMRTEGHLLVMVEAAAPAPMGARAVVLAEPMLAPSSTWAPKTLSYWPSLWAREQAAARGADEGLRLFPGSLVGEGAAANLFAVLGGELVTPPPLGIRPGVTRARVLALAAARGVPTRQRPISEAELHAADELFLTSSIAGVVPIVELDGAGRRPGTLTAELGAAYEAAVH